MTKIMFLLLYVLVSGQPRMEHELVDSIEACVEKGEARLVELTLDEKVMGIAYAGCIEVPAVAVSKNDQSSATASAAAARDGA